MHRYVLPVVALLLIVLVMGRATATRIGLGTGYQPGPLFLTLTQAPDGGWTSIPHPKAYHYNGKTYFTWTENTGAIRVASYDHTTRVVSTPITLATGLPDEGVMDNHNAGSVLVRDSDKRVIVAYAGHLDSIPRYRVSTNPEDVTSFGSAQTLSGIGVTGTITYITQMQLLGLPNQPIYMFWREFASSTGHLAYAVSIDGGATWSSRVRLVSGASGNVPYWSIESDWDSRIDIFITDRAPGNSSSLYHFYLDGSDGKRYKTDGTEITASLPIAPTAGTLVLANTNGSVAMFGGSWDGSAPAVAMLQRNGSSDNRALTGRWRSGAWQIDTVLSSVGGQLGINQFASGMAINHTDPDSVLVARKIGSRFEMYRYTSPDDGASWSGQALTSGSPVDNVWAEVPHFAAEGLTAIWLRGTYTSDTNFNFGVAGSP